MTMPRRRFLVGVGAGAAAWPVVALFLPATATAGPPPPSPLEGRTRFPETTGGPTLRIQGWDDEPTTPGEGVWIALDRSWRAAWR